MVEAYLPLLFSAPINKAKIYCVERMSTSYRCVYNKYWLSYTIYAHSFYAIFNKFTSSKVQSIPLKFAFAKINGLLLLGLAEQKTAVRERCVIQRLLVFIAIIKFGLLTMASNSLQYTQLSYARLSTRIQVPLFPNHYT